MLRTIAEALGIFVVSMMVLYVFYHITLGQRATSMVAYIAWINSKGIVLICVGVMYIVCGAVLLTLKR